MFKQRIISLEKNLTQKIISKNPKILILKTSGPLGNTSLSLIKTCIFQIIKRDIFLTSVSKNNMFGTYYKLVTNTYKGLVGGYKVFLEIKGVGYKIGKINTGLQVDAGFSAPITFFPKKGLIFSIKKNKILRIFGNSLGLVKQAASRLRLFKKPEPYKGKGLRYLNEKVIIKEGKKKKK